LNPNVIPFQLYEKGLSLGKAVSQDEEDTTSTCPDTSPLFASSPLLNQFLIYQNFFNKTKNEVENQKKEKKEKAISNHTVLHWPRFLLITYGSLLFLYPHK
jgi:hypothetical protein